MPTVNTAPLPHQLPHRSLLAGVFGGAFLGRLGMPEAEYEDREEDGFDAGRGFEVSQPRFEPIGFPPRRSAVSVGDMDLYGNVALTLSDAAADAVVVTQSLMTFVRRIEGGGIRLWGDTPGGALCRDPPSWAP